MLDSHSRLQVILNETGTNVEHRIWLAEGLFYMTQSERFDKDVRKGDLKGNPRTGNTGLCEDVPSLPAGPPCVPATS